MTKRKFLTTDEIAIFMQGPEETGVQSATVYGPCDTAFDAWIKASRGYDADHFVGVVRMPKNDLCGEDVTEEVAAAIITDAIRSGDTAGLPRFVDESELEQVFEADGRDYKATRPQGFTARILGVGAYK